MIHTFSYLSLVLLTSAVLATPSAFASSSVPVQAAPQTSDVIQQSTSSTLDTLESTLEATYGNNTEIQTQINRLHQSNERLVQAKAGYRPTITGTASLGTSKTINGGDQVNPRINGNAVRKSSQNPVGNVGVELKQNLYAGGKTVAEVNSAQSQILSERARLTETEQTIFAQGVQVFLDILTKEAEIEQYVSNVNYLKSSLTATQAKYDVGEDTQTSVAQAQAQLAEGEAQLETARAQLDSLKATYKRITGRNPKKLIKPQQISQLLPANLEQALQVAAENHPSVLRAKHEENAARHDIDRIGAGLLPSLDLRATGQKQKSKDISNYTVDPRTYKLNNSNTNMSATLTLTVPIYEGGNVRSQKRQAHEIVAEKRINIETVRRQVAEKLAEAWSVYLASKANIKNYQAQVAASKVSLEGVRQEMLVGTKILLDVLNAQKALLQAQLNLVRAERDYYIQAYQLLLYMGSLTAKQLKLKVNYYNPSVHYNDTKDKF